MSTGETATPYRTGFSFGAELARNILGDNGSSDMMQVNAGYMPDRKPMSYAERVDWLNGMARGILHVSFTLAVSIRMQRKGGPSDAG